METESIRGLFFYNYNVSLWMEILGPIDTGGYAYLVQSELGTRHVTYLRDIKDLQLYTAEEKAEAYLEE